MKEPLENGFHCYLMV